MGTEKQIKTCCSHRFSDSLNCPLPVRLVLKIVDIETAKDYFLKIKENGHCLNTESLKISERFET